jgi:hypothetical protein
LPYRIKFGCVNSYLPFIGLGDTGDKPMVEVELTSGGRLEKKRLSPEEISAMVNQPR